MITGRNPGKRVNDMLTETLISGQVLADVSIEGNHIINGAGLFLMTG